MGRTVKVLREVMRAAQGRRGGKEHSGAGDEGKMVRMKRRQ